MEIIRMKVKSVMMSQVVNVDGCDYYIAEINTKGNKEILELDIIKPVEGKPITIECIFDTKTGEIKHSFSMGAKGVGVAYKLVNALQLFFCQKSVKWKLAY
jgi:hypothetical protein